MYVMGLKGNKKHETTGIAGNAVTYLFSQVQNEYLIKKNV